MDGDEVDELDDLIIRIRAATQRPTWRRNLLAGSACELAIGDLRVLRAVERRGRLGGDVSIGDVAEDIGVEHSTASRAVTSVVAKQLLTRSVSTTDQRRNSLALTKSGREALAETTQRRRSMVAEVVADWLPADLARLNGLFDRLVADFETDRS